MKNLLCACCMSLFSLMGFAQVTNYTVTTTGESIKIDPTKLESGASPNYTQSGRTIVNNQGTFFGWFLYPYMTEAIQARFSLWQGDQLVQLSEIYDIDVNQNGNNGRRIPFYINAPAGKYKVKPLLRRLSNDYWTIPKDKSDYGDMDDDRFSYKNWEYNIEDINTHKAPSILLLKSEGLSEELVQGHGVPTLFNEPEQRNRYERFDVMARFSNKSNKTKKGKIKLLWERDFDQFWLGYSKTVPVMTQWHDCVSKGATMNGYTDWDGTGLPVEIPANTNEISFDIKGCYAGTFHDWGSSYSPYVHVYFQPEGSNEWILCGVDAADEFNADYSVIPSLYQKNCNNFALWITDATDNSANPEQIPFVYDKADKTITLSAMPEKTYIYLYDMDGANVKAESVIANGTYTLKTNGLPSGAYLLKIINGTAVKTVKLIL